MANEQWITVDHPLWKKPAALVGLQDGNFVGYIPLMDARDANGDGKVSALEWLASKMPIFGKLAADAETGAIMQAIALDERVLDVQLYGEGEKKIWAAAMVAVKEAISALYIKKIAGPAATALLGTCSLTGASYFVAKKGLEQLFKSMIDRAVR
jgi:hypothetical protein